MMRRVNRIGISLGLLLTAVSSVSVWLLVHIWVWGPLIVQEPRFPILVAETIGVGLTGVFGLFGVVYFWRYSWKRH